MRVVDLHRLSMGVEEVQLGFDWGDGNVFLTPDAPLKKDEE